MTALALPRSAVLLAAGVVYILWDGRRRARRGNIAGIPRAIWPVGWTESLREVREVPAS